jgi:hypothetical protein
MANFIGNHPIISVLFILWLLGVIAHTCLLIGMMLFRIATIYSIRHKNLLLIGLQESWITGKVDPYMPIDSSWKDRTVMFFLAILMHCFNGVMGSWAGAFLLIFMIVKTFFDWLTTPSNIKELHWRAKNVEYRRAEDFLALTNKVYLPDLKETPSHDLEEIKARVEKITHQYAAGVFPENHSAVEKYQELARAQSKLRFDSDIIHPAFWSLQMNKNDAVKMIGADLTNYSSR